MRVEDASAAGFGPGRPGNAVGEALGEAGRDGEVDLLMGMPVEGEKGNKQVEIRVGWREVQAPMEILVSTSEDLARGIFEGRTDRAAGVIWRDRRLATADGIQVGSGQGPAAGEGPRPTGGVAYNPTDAGIAVVDCGAAVFGDGD